MHSIPFRICQADGFERLLVAGRTVSADQDAESSLRVIPILGAIGQACGTAAGLAAVSGKTVDEIVGSVLQTRLLSDGCII